MKRILLFLMVLLAHLGYSQTSNMPSSLGTFNVFSKADLPITIVMPPNYTLPTPVIEIWNNGSKLSDSTVVTALGDTLKFTITKAQLAPLNRNAYFFLRSGSKYLLGAVLKPSIGVGVPSTTTKTVSLPSVGTIRLNVAGDASVVLAAAAQAKAYADSSKSIYAASGGLITTRVKYGTIAQLRVNPEPTSRFDVTDLGKQGAFLYDITDMSSADDGVMVVVTNTGKRYKRIVNGYANVQWWGVKGDSITNETTLIQAAIDNPKVRTLFFPKAYYRVGVLTIDKNDKALVFEEGSILEGLGLQGAFGFMVTIKSCSNVSITAKGAIFRDNKAAYTPQQGNGAIRIMSANNVTIDGVNIVDTAGDGIYLGAQTFGVTNNNIRLLNCIVDGVYRNAFTVVTVNGLDMIDCVGKNVNNGTGVFPKAGIDFEPNNNSENLTRIRLSNFVTENNGGPGISVVPYPIAGTGRLVDIIVDGHKDKGSFIGFQMGDARGTIEGQIIINNPVWENNVQNSFLALNYTSLAGRVQINSPLVVNPGTGGYVSAAFLIYRRNIANQGTQTIGNIHIRNPIIRNNTGATYGGYAFYYDDATNTTSPVENCSLIDIQELTGVDPEKIVYGKEVSLLLRDSYRQLQRNVTADYSITHGNFLDLYHNASATGTVVISLQNSILTSLQKRVTFEVRAGQILRIVPTSATVSPYTTVASSSIESNVIGSKIVLEKSGASSWKVVEVVGSWRDSFGTPFSSIQPISGRADSNQDFTLDPGRPRALFYISAVNRTVLLPAAATCRGVPYRIKKVVNNAFTITVSTADGSNIEAAPTKVISNYLEEYTFVSDGTQFWITN